MQLSIQSSAEAGSEFRESAVFSSKVARAAKILTFTVLQHGGI